MLLCDCVTLLDHEMEVKVFNWSLHTLKFYHSIQINYLQRKYWDIKLGIFRFLQLVHSIDFIIAVNPDHFNSVSVSQDLQWKNLTLTRFLNFFINFWGSFIRIFNFPPGMETDRETEDKQKIIIRLWETLFLTQPSLYFNITTFRSFRVSLIISCFSN